MANSIVFNPFITGSFDFVGGGADPNFLDPVATESLLPISPAPLNGALCVVQATNQVYEYSTSTSKWSNVTQKFIDGLAAASATGLVSNITTNVNNVLETHIALTPADATHPGVLTTGAQTLAGIKTLSSALYAEGGIDRAGGTTLDLGAVNAANVLIGTPSSNTTIQSSSVTLDAVAAKQVLTTDSAQNIVGTSLTNGQILIGSTGGAPTAATITGTANQVNVTNAANSITLNTPQDIATTSTPTFTGIITGNIDTLGAGTLGIGFTNASTINIGHSGATVNIQGTTNTVNVTNYNVANKLMNLNTAGPAASGSGVGVTVEENSIVTGYIETSGDRNSWNMLAPNTAGIVTITPGVSGFTLNQGSHNPLSLSTPGLGLSLDAANQILSAQYASSGQPGLLSTAAQTIDGVKTFTSAPNLSSLTASYALVTDASKNVASLMYTSANAGNTIVSRNVDGNASFNNMNVTTTVVVSSGQTIAMNHGSAGAQIITGSANVAFNLPDATYMTINENFLFDVDTTGIVSVYLNDGVTLVKTLTSGSYTVFSCIDNLSLNGAWSTRTLLTDTAISNTAGTTVPGFMSANTLVSTVATGTAPFTVTSTTPVANLIASNISGIAAISNGGTNSAAALSNNKVMVSTAGAIVESATTTTTLGYLDATSSIQTQFNNLFIPGDIGPSSFLGSNNVSSPANVTGVLFNGAITRSFEMQMAVYINATTNVTETFFISGAFDGIDWIYDYNSTGDSTGVVFGITTGGQLTYMSPATPGYISMKMSYRAQSLGI